MNGHQRGIALISVLLVLSLALLITGGLLRSHHLSLQSSGQQLQQIQLRQLALGGETWALLRPAAPAHRRSRHPPCPAFSAPAPARC